MCNISSSGWIRVCISEISFLKRTAQCDTFCPEMHEDQGGLGEAGFCPEMHEGGRSRGRGMWVAAKFDCPKWQAVPRRHRIAISNSIF